MANGESVVSQTSIAQRAEALEKKEAEVAKGGEADAAAKAVADKAAADKAAADKEASDKAAAEKKPDLKKEGSEKPEKKVPNDPEELRKWNTRNAQENKKLREELAATRESNEKIAKMLAGMSKKDIDFKELAKDPEKVKKFIEEEREAIRSEYEEKLTTVQSQERSKDITLGKMRREVDTENYPEWKRVYPHIMKLALGPTGQGDPRIDFTKPVDELLDSLYELAMNENPKPKEEEKPVVPAEKTYTESEMKALISDMVGKEKEAIAKTAREEALKEAQAQLSEETKGGTVASAGKGSGRMPTDHLAAFKKMTLSQQREWLQAQSEAK